MIEIIILSFISITFSSIVTFVIYIYLDIDLIRSFMIFISSILFFYLFLNDLFYILNLKSLFGRDVEFSALELKGYLESDDHIGSTFVNISLFYPLFYVGVILWIVE